MILPIDGADFKKGLNTSEGDAGVSDALNKEHFSGEECLIGLDRRNSEVERFHMGVVEGLCVCAPAALSPALCELV